jgi:hypothetical protein
MGRTCVYPELPINQGETDTRTFKYGEPVCLRGQTGDITTGTYNRSIRVDNKITTHIVDSPGFPGRYVDWKELGKIPQPVSKTAVTKLSIDKNLPENIEKKIQKYGGKRRYQKTRKNKQKRKHSKTRKH